MGTWQTIELTENLAGDTWSVFVCRSNIAFRSEASYINEPRYEIIKRQRMFHWTCIQCCWVARNNCKVDISFEDHYLGRVQIFHLRLTWTCRESKKAWHATTHQLRSKHEIKWLLVCNRIYVDVSCSCERIYNESMKEVLNIRLCSS